MKTNLCLLFLISLPLAFATDYYVSNSGNDNNNGLSTSNPWQTISKVNSMSFSPGDTIYFRAGDVWREQLTIPSSGSSGNPITFTRYGSGDNPMIRSSELITAGDWVHENPPSGHIYSYNTRAVDDGWRNPHGAAEPNGKILDKFWYYRMGGPYTAPSSHTNPVISELESNMMEGFTWSPHNLGKIFIYSNGNPGTLEVGRRTNVIDWNSRQYITIDGIDAYGPGGGILDYTDTPESWRQGLIRAMGTNSILRNSVVKNSMYHGVRGVGSNSLIENNQIEWVWGGVHSYNANRDVVVRGNTFKYIGAQKVSNGDRGVIGTWGNHWLVEYNHIESNGWRGQVDPDGTTHALDSAIIFCCGDDMSTPVPSGDNIVRYNYLKNIANGAITLDSGDNNQVYNNIIDGWNLQYTGYGEQSNTGAIRMNTWPVHAHPLYIGNKIYNNVITGGRDVPEHDNDGAIQVSGETRNMEIKNNLIFGNDPGILALYASFRTGSRDNEIENNIFLVPSGNGVRWWGEYYDFQHLVSPTGCPNAGYWQCDKATGNTGIVRNNIVANPQIGSNYHLLSGSPAIDAGINVGLSEDFDGTSISGLPDIGAQEYTGTTCNPDWVCTGWSSWSACVGNQQSRTRTCTDANNCGTTTGKPSESETQSCSVSQGDELVLHLTFDSVSGSTVTDNSGKGNSGTLTGGASVSSGRVGNAAQLDGTNDYISVSESATLDFDKSAGTIMMWVRPTSLSSHNLLAMDSNFEMEFNTADGRPFIYPYADNPGYRNYNMMDELLETDVWQHIAVTWDYTNKEAKIFKYGAEVSYLTENVPGEWNTVASTGNWHFGGSPVKPGQYLQGFIDEVKMYNYVLTPAEVYSQYFLAPAHAADNDRDMCVELTELVTYMDAWKSGTVLMAELVSAISEWKAGC